MTIGTIEAQKTTVAAEEIDTAGRRITDRIRPADAVERHIGLGHVLSVLPEFFAGGGIDADVGFLGHRPGLHGIARFPACGHLAATADGIDLAVHDDGTGHATDVIFPDQVFTLRGPAIGKIFLTTYAILFRPAPAIPIARVSGDCADCRGNREEPGS